MSQLGTFAQMSERFATAEQAETTATTATGTTAETQPEIITTEQAQTTTELPNTTTETTTEIEPEINSSTFSTLLDGDQPIATTDQPQATTAQPLDWKEAIKKADKSELYKEIGLSDFAIEINEHIAKGGKAIDYLHARAVDYNAVPDADIIKSNIKQQYPTFSEAQVNLIYERKYGVGEDALDSDREFAELQLKMDAQGIRQQLIGEQQKFKVPDTVQYQQDPEYTEWKKQLEDYPRVVEENKNFYLTHEATKTLNESKRVAISLGKDVPAFNFNVDQPESITRAMTDGGETWRKLTSTKTGEPDVQKQQLITLFSFNPQKFIEDIFNYGQQMGVRNKVVGEGQNAQRPKANVIPISTDAQPTYGIGKFGDRQR